jgi:hypothetical protein
MTAVGNNDHETAVDNTDHDANTDVETRLL